jgi:plastocyanin
MTKVIVISKRQIRMWAVIAAVAAVTVGTVWYWGYNKGAEHNQAFKPASTSIGVSGQARTIQIVTGEFKTTGTDGKVIEAYRWDPGTIYVKKGETIHLSIYGVNGTSHPFIIDGLNVKGEVKQGKETVVTFRADQPGTYRIVCLIHPDIAHNGPMVGYIVVDT